ncbi:asparagine synthase (glutamine-hydrolyzing) [Nesterenkonia natronophila]|uniref:asparagine synthase (glutamine-hydrolyzing) n=1 Tax=Nesterenkonia natronophila TaxID=2174932 RepID=A0A3A4F7Y1_9MICC|nr:asparagine synthase (glutamine-hydrolyzing) [Nesterenkonia natronophila]RJN32600.1 asparagine synthase (glutamine-hydrolyzing) [Nesterenkonia natronophila]
MSAIVAAHGPIDVELGQRMLKRMAHRGPDGSQTHQVGQAWLGSQYLSITDPDDGAQPLGEAQQAVWLVGDGKIYNYRRIREELGEERFRTRSDLETALQLYQERGLAAFSQLWGNFALVIAAEDGRFVAARDALGIAPLYWAERGETTLFASELKAFDEDWRPAVEPFPPGHIWTPDGGLVTGPTFPVTAPALLKSRAPYEEPPAWVFDALRETVIRSVERSMDSAVPLGVLLSGGVDSSIVTAIAAKLAADRGQTIPTFAVGMEGSGDLAAARLVAEHAGTEHKELIYTAEDAIELVPQIIAELESFDPTLVHSAVPHHMVSELAAEHVKVVLAGEGADELFAGYAHYGQHETGAALHEDLLSTIEGMHIGGLQRVDRVAGAHGLEPRVPFLDLDVVELALALPPEWKLTGTDRPAKWMLRRAFDGWLPDEVLWRRKEQFGEGTGMNEVLREHYGQTVTEQDLHAEAAAVDPPLRTREELAYYRMFTDTLPGLNVGRTIGRFVQA